MSNQEFDRVVFERDMMKAALLEIARERAGTIWDDVEREISRGYTNLREMAHMGYDVACNDLGTPAICVLAALGYWENNT
jgi:hypothetical protein